MKLTPDEALHLQAAEVARNNAMAAIDRGGELVYVAIDLRNAAEAYRLVAEELSQRALAEARKAAGR